ncbi:MAG: histidinol-phosphate aminotransferase [Pseudonocardiales bacterium]|nr:histidinol-phosphate aminotransferase [Pseudonocardiales bacterium]
MTGPEQSDPGRPAPAAAARGAAKVELQSLPLRAELRGMSPYGAPQLDVAHMLNTNENPYPLPDALIESINQAVRAQAGRLNRYPDRDARALRADLARYLGHGLSPDEVWAANGSNEIIQQLLQAFAGAGRTVLGFVPSYSMYPLLSAGTGSRFLAGSREAGFGLSPAAVTAEIQRHQPDVVILCSPNNPTGTSLELSVVRAALEVAPGMVLVDEAYAEFARPGTVSALSLLPDAARLVVSRTMSKAFGMAGLRLGYFAASAAVVEAVQLVRLTYHLSTLTQVVARAALAHADALLATVEAIKQQRGRMAAGLLELGLRPAPSDANFLLVGEFSDERAMWQQLLDRGVLVRDVGLPGRLRVTVGTEQETGAFLDAVRSVLEERPELRSAPA